MKSRIGEKHKTNEGYEIEIIEYFRYSDITIKFENGYIVTNNTYQNFKNGEIKNPYHPSVYGIGYNGVGNYKSKINKENTLEYGIWFSMLTRCYDKKYNLKHPTYNKAIVCDEWHDFQVFGEWVKNNYVKGWCLDKDILFKNNKIYSPDTCCFVPSEINLLFTKNDAKRGNLPIGVSKYNKTNKFISTLSVNNKQIRLNIHDNVLDAFNDYKETKEKLIKEIADKWKPFIPDYLYSAMYRYKIEITD